MDFTNVLWQRKRLRNLKAWAMKHFPLTFPVRVYLREPTQCPGMLGYFQYDDDTETGIIVISRACASPDELSDCFNEEWSHARTVFLWGEDDEDPHNSSFWSELGRITMAARERW